MGRTKSATWIAGTVILALLILVAAWFLLVSPRLESASTMETQRTEEQSRLDQIEIQIAGLARDFANIEEFRADLNLLREAIPGDERLAEVTRDLSRFASASGVTITNVSPGTPVLTAGAVTVDPATDPAAAPADPATGDAAAGGTTGTAAPADAAPPSLTYAMPVDVVTKGTYGQTLAFIDQIQALNPRLYVLARISASTQEDMPATASLPATARGDLETRYTIYAFVIPDSSLGVMPEDTGEEPAEPEPLPIPTTPRQPFEPLS